MVVAVVGASVVVGSSTSPDIVVVDCIKISPSSVVASDFVGVALVVAVVTVVM